MVQVVGASAGDENACQKPSPAAIFTLTYSNKAQKNREFLYREMPTRNRQTQQTDRKEERMTQPDYISALNIPLKEKDELDPDIQEAFAFIEQEHGVIPNVLTAYSFDPEKLRPFMQMYNNLMMAESPLSELEREMIAVVVSSANRCLYCLVAHGAAVRGLSGDPKLGELMVMNYRTAELQPRHRALLDFAVKVTEESHRITEQDREELRRHGFSDLAIWDICAVAAFFNMTNRMASALDMMPNKEYHYWHRTDAE
jgi:uncharacterized peroxidase-related enzyme